MDYMQEQMFSLFFLEMYFKKVKVESFPGFPNNGLHATGQVFTCVLRIFLKKVKVEI